MEPEAHKRAHRALLDALLGGREGGPIERHFSADHALHQSLVPPLPPGRASLAWAAAELGRAFGASFVQLADQVASDDRCLSRFRAQVKHTGAIGPLHPSGRWVHLTGMILSRFADGVMVESWIEVDAFGVLDQLDAVELVTPGEEARDGV